MDRQPDADPGALRSLLARTLGVGVAVPVTFERTADGVARRTYRLKRGGTTLYLQLAEEADHDLQVDVTVLERLRLAGATVPEVVHVERFDEALGASVLIMGEIPGVPLALVADPVVARRVAEAAVADAARFAAVPVDGFGWVDRRDPAAPLRGTLDSYRTFVTSEMLTTAGERRVLTGALLGDDHIARIEGLLSTEAERPLLQGCLAHGDLDATAVYCHGGRYSGTIDLSELRGAEPGFDLGHFLLHDGETSPTPLYAAFRRGWDTTWEGDDVDPDAVRTSAILSGYRQLCRWLARFHPRAQEAPLPRRRAAELANLLDGRPAAPSRPPREPPG